ncbi:MAG: LytTR family DNA-binding domain-containing protein [Roseburia sp.]|nr:LytTR family DNA-binding domain-containing protein [Ruminococcus flavefaciens]MCM1284460.1 LytTR family DNA-binding domain-containing protein [Roseburia sp.]MCM1432253.1 LytTR family DNA-binding domain-containing protein [Muribaculaceae bacterium]
MIHIAICEDNDDDMTHLRSLLCQIKIPCDFTEYASAEPLLLDMETRRKQFDIFLLDILMPGSNGVETARHIRRLEEKAILIFLTSSEDFYREAFDLYAFHYLLKPVCLAGLTEVLTKAACHIPAAEESLHIMSRGQNILLRHADITYIDSSNHVLCFHMQDGQKYSSYGRLDEILTQLASGLFVRCHKSFIINLIHVDRLTREGFHIGNTLIPISRTYAVSAKESYHKRLFGIFQEH